MFRPKGQNDNEVMNNRGFPAKIGKPASSPGLPRKSHRWAGSTPSACNYMLVSYEIFLTYDKDFLNLYLLISLRCLTFLLISLNDSTVPLFFLQETEKKFHPTHSLIDEKISPPCPFIRASFLCRRNIVIKIIPNKCKKTFEVTLKNLIKSGRPYDLEMHLSQED